MTRPIRSTVAACVMACLGLALSGCQMATTFFSKSTSFRTPMAPAMEVIPSSTRSYSETMRMAKTMTLGDPSLWIGQVAATGSMRPYLGESSLVVLEPANPERMQGGSLLAFNREGSMFIHVLVALTPEGAMVRGATSDTTELVPYASFAGTAMAVLYFDPKSAPMDRAGIPLLLAANREDVPAASGSLRILSAAMLAGSPVTIYPLSVAGEYTATLGVQDSLSVSLGVPGNLRILPASAAVTWSAALAGQTIEYQIYNPAAPEIGHILLRATFQR